MCVSQNFDLLVGGEDGRHSGWTSLDPTRRRNSGPIGNDGILSRQKAPVANDSTGSKDAMVCMFDYRGFCFGFPVILPGIFFLWVNLFNKVELLKLICFYFG